MEKFVYPQYNGRSLLNVPSTILSLFGLKPIKPTLPKTFYQNAIGAEKIILFIFDGLGYNLLQKVGLKYSFFQNITQNGFYSPITTVFPSTTAAALNSLHSGLSPLEHGLPEWFVYFKEIDALLASLPFTPVDPADWEKTLNPPIDILFKDKTIYQRLKKIPVPSFSLVSKNLTESLYTQTSLNGSNITGYDGVEDSITILRKLVETSGKLYITAYYSLIDTAEHEFGPWSEQVEDEILKLSKVLQNEFIEKIDPSIASKIAVLFTSDHGQVEVDPNKAIYLDEIDTLVQSLNTTPSGKPIPPTSGTRNAFLSVKAGKLDSIIKLLQAKLKEKVFVLSMDQALSGGIFGPGEVSSRFLDRTGNILLISLSDYTLGYHYTPDFELKFIGRHGGLSQDEMIIPFACARLSELKQR